jgi:2-C-methyl-D-erythritol 2,4-cyclodiphosphate synthase
LQQITKKKIHHIIMKIRVGFGYDVHQLVEGRELWLGGIKLEHTLGLLGHSDADVLIHAICDALLGAANMRDIGYHFPDNAGEFKNIDSKILLKRTVELIATKGYRVGNIDATVCAERPKLKARIPEMQQTLAGVMDIDPDDVSIKATTTEKLGFTGREEGISAYATVLIEK